MTDAEQKLTTLGRAALYDYMVDALLPDSFHGLKKQAVMEDENITDGDLRIMVARVADVDRGSAQKEITNRADLVARLDHLIERTILKSQTYVGDEQPTLRRNSQASDDVNPDTLRHQTKRQHAVAQGQSGNVTQRVLRNARYAAGWQSLSTLHAGIGSSKPVAERLVKEYKAARLAEGMTSGEAEAKMQRRYIAVTPKDVVRSDSFVEKFRQEKLEGRAHITTWIDLSPEAIKDFERISQEITERKVAESPIYSLFKKYDLSYDHEVAKRLVKGEWNKAVKKRQAEGDTLLNAEDWVQKHHIDGKTHVMHFRLGKNIQHSALFEIDTALLAAMEKGEVQRPGGVVR